MIRNWRYDTGEPYYMSNIDKWTEPRIPAWRGAVYTKDMSNEQREEFDKWIKDHETSTEECTWRFNNGDPFFQIEIRNEEDALAFFMTWGE